MQLKLIDHPTGFALATEDGQVLPGQCDLVIDNKLGEALWVTVTFKLNPCTRTTRDSKRGPLRPEPDTTRQAC